MNSNLALRSNEERASIERDRVAALLVHNMNRGRTNLIKVKARLAKLDPEQREDMQTRIDKYQSMADNKWLRHRG